MNDQSRLLALASGNHPELTPEQMIQVSAAAGFNSVCLRVDSLDDYSPSKLTRLRSLLEQYQLTLLDIEVIRLRDDAQSRQLAYQIIDIAGALGANNVLLVSNTTDALQTRRLYSELCHRAETAGVRAVLEFMYGTQVITLLDAVAVIEDVAHPSGGILVDSFHFSRNHDRLADLAAIDTHWLPYMQLCDAPWLEPAFTNVDSYLDAARHDRRLPGEGHLPLMELLQYLPETLPISLEILSRQLRETYPNPLDRAHIVRNHTERFFQCAE